MLNPNTGIDRTLSETAVIASVRTARRVKLSRIGLLVACIRVSLLRYAFGRRDLRSCRDEGGSDPFAALSPREREILSLLTDGLGNAEIAERLSIAEKTVRNHISSIYDKLGVWTRAQAMVFARDHGFNR